MSTGFDNWDRSFFDPDKITTITEVHCFNCEGNNAEAKLVPMNIPYFKNIVVVYKGCLDCNYKSTEIENINEIETRGVSFTLSAQSRSDLNRQVVRSNTATLRFPQIDFEIAPTRIRGEINTLEGMIRNIIDNLNAQVESRRGYEDQIEVIVKLTELITYMTQCSEGTPFEFEIRDPSGNSFIENLHAPQPDPYCKVERFVRNRDDDILVGIEPADLTEEEREKYEQARNIERQLDLVHKSKVDDSILNKMDVFTTIDSGKLVVIDGICSECHKANETRMCLTTIPNFKEIIMMVTQCFNCGFKDTEIKPSGKISDKAKKITLKVTSVSDLKRDILKSDTAGIEIPEIELILTHGTLGGKYTTLEGLLNDISAQLKGSNPFLLGDSSEADSKNEFQTFLDKLDSLSDVEQPWTIIVDDPLANSYVYNPYDPEADPNMTEEYYERTYEQNDELGLNDINTDNYLSPEDELDIQKDTIELEAQKEEERKRIQAEEMKQIFGKVGGLIKPKLEGDE